MVSIACLMYGSNPNGYAGFLDPDLLPEQRAASCQEEYSSKSRAWNRLLEDHTR